MCPASHPENRSYHHGDLRRALVDAALVIVRQQGLDSLTMRGVARAANVSHMAPYHHFHDKAALIAAVAAEGFRRLRDAMAERVASCSEGPPRARLRQSGVAYVVFAVKNPNLFRVMFSSDVVESDDPDLQEASAAAYALLRGLVDDSRATKRVDRAEAEMMSVSAWALVHGLAILCIDGQLGQEGTTPEFAEKFAYEATGALHRGLRNG
ncbi:MAG: TetR/AcrR family transcriptional regulator [Gemmatimonadales bacterium]